MMDQQALEVVLMSGVEMHVMPINVAIDMKFLFEKITEKLPQNSNFSILLLDRWFQHLDGGRKERIIWDLALIQAIIFPEWVERKTITKSKDNGKRSNHYYSSIDATKMKEDFFKTINQFIQQN